MLIFRWDLPCSTYFIIAEQPSVMVIAEVNRPLIRIGYYGSACCQSRLCVLHLCQDENIVQKQHGVAWRPPWALPDSSGDGARCVLAPPWHGRFSKEVFPGHFKSGKSSQIPGKELSSLNFLIYKWKKPVPVGIITSHCIVREEIMFVRVLWKLEISLWK